MIIFLLKINWFASFKNFRISLYFFIGIFKDIFLLILLYFWNCHFILKTNTNFSIENQLVFASIIFLLKINTKFSIEFITLSKHFHAFALVDQRHFSINFAIYLKLRFCIENEWSFFYWKSIDLPASKTLGFPFIFYIGIFKEIFLLILLILYIILYFYPPKGDA